MTDSSFPASKQTVTIMSGKADCPPEMRKRKKKSNHSLAYQIQTTLRSEIKRSSSVTGVILYKLRSFSQVRIRNTCSPSAILVLFKKSAGLRKKIEVSGTACHSKFLMFYYVIDL